MKSFPKKYLGYNNRLSLEILNSDEPNNGRMLWGVEFLIDAKDIGTKITNSWNYISYDLSRYQFQSTDKRHIFVPFEKNGYLFELTNGGQIEYTKLLYGDSWFKFNIFSEKNLAVFNYETAYIIGLDNKKIEKISLGKDKEIVSAQFINKSQLEITFWELQTKGSVTKRTEMNKILQNII